MGRVHKEAWRRSSDVSSWRKVSLLGESFISRWSQSRLLGYTYVRMRSQCLKLKVNREIPKMWLVGLQFMCGHKLAVEQIRVVVQARPLPGAVHRPSVGRCATPATRFAFHFRLLGTLPGSIYSKTVISLNAALFHQRAWQLRLKST